jgi:hypothetical protein
MSSFVARPRTLEYFLSATWACALCACSPRSRRTLRFPRLMESIAQSLPLRSPARSNDGCRGIVKRIGQSTSGESEDSRQLSGRRARPVRRSSSQCPRPCNPGIRDRFRDRAPFPIARRYEFYYGKRHLSTRDSIADKAALAATPIAPRRATPAKMSADL